ncbi:MAG: MAPEG family protein [Erythrobacter sp.]|nr:MAPEG family protein [Erythrobacter sp.]
MQAQMLAPAAVLVLWTLVIMVWIIPARFGAIAKIEDKSRLPAKRGLRGADLEGVLPDKANWPAHNHTHLHEQPTLFYAAVVMLAIMGPTGFDVLVAWVYVGLRIVHSLWQILVNKIPLRFLLFLLSSIAMIILAVRAVMATVLADPSALPA